MPLDPTWNDPERVARFAERDADHRLSALLPTYEDPAAVAVLDLGCAGGRNTALLAEAGFDVYALDAAAAMVARTRERLAAFLGEAEARRRVVEGAMTALQGLPRQQFRLVVALGIYHQATSEGEGERALAETARVVAPGGRVLVSHFAPGTRLEGREAHLWLLPADRLDAAFARHGFCPELPSSTVTRTLETSRRVTVNALYRKQTPS